MSWFTEFKSWITSSTRSRFLMGRRLTISFPTSLDKRVAIVELPYGSSHIFKIKKSNDPDSKQASVVLVSGEDEIELGVFESEAAAISALGVVRRSFTKPVAKFIKVALWVILALIVLEWATSPLNSKQRQQMQQMQGQPSLPASLVGTPAPANQQPVAGYSSQDTLSQLQEMQKNRPSNPSNVSEDVINGAAPNTPAATAPTGSAPEADAVLQMLKGKK